MFIKNTFFFASPARKRERRIYVDGMWKGDTRRFAERGGEGASVKRAAIRESQRHAYANNHKQSLRRLSLAPS